MPTFLHQPLLWGLLIVGVPVLIHLINVLRHRRVRWAAMEFLLVSQKRNRTWILLKQLFLLALRMLVVACVVLVLAEPLLRNRLGGLFGAGRTHHVVLLDDSFSMSDRWGDTSAFEEAKRVVAGIATQAHRQPQPQTFTLLRFSRAGRPVQGTEPDFLQESVEADLIERLRERLESLAASHTAAGPMRALEALRQLVGSSDRDRHIVYLISDFRAREWEEPGDLRNRLAQLGQMGAKLYLIRCVEATRPNLAIAELSPGVGTRSAGVPLSMELTVRNFSGAPVRDVPVLLEADGSPLTAVTIARIPPEEAVRERFQVHFPTAGQHAITARLETDVVAVDNFRYRVLEFPEEVPVLLIDGDPAALGARYLSAALAPGGPVPTGIKPQIETPRYLSLNSLEPFRAIYLLNFDRLDESAVEALERYAASGGGVGVFLGERCRAKFVNEALYRDGKGFFPVLLAGPAELLEDRLQRTPDLEVTGHPIFRVFAGERNSFISTVIVERYFSVPKDWRPAAGSATRVIARLRNGAPLVVEGKFGEGRVVVMLTSAAPVWNNWARNNPSFVVAMLELQAFLATKPSEDTSSLVGTPIRLQLDPSQYEAQARFSVPDRSGASPMTVDMVPTPEGALSAPLPTDERSGIYEVSLTRKEGGAEIRRYAVNVEAGEGDLKTLGGAELAARLKGIDYDFVQAATFEYTAEELAGYNLSEPLMYLLILLLAGEQILAWSASYHPPARQRLGPKGGGG